MNVMKMLTTLLIFSCGSATSVCAQQASTSNAVRQFGGWSLSCAANNAQGNVCELNQSVMDYQQRLVFRLAVGTRQGDGSVVSVVAQIPVNVSFTEAPRLKFNPEDQPTQLAFRSCTAGGCIADGVLSSATLALMKGARGGAGAMEFKDASGKPIQFPLTSNGFAQAWPAYLETLKPAPKAQKR